MDTITMIKLDTNLILWLTLNVKLESNKKLEDKTLLYLKQA